MGRLGLSSWASSLTLRWPSQVQQGQREHNTVVVSIKEKMARDPNKFRVSKISETEENQITVFRKLVRVTQH